MISLFKVELYKYFKSRSYIIFSIVLVISFILPIFLLQLNGIELHPITTAYEVLQFNSYLILPFMTTFHFSFFLSNEYRNGGIKLLFSSIYPKDTIFLMKFAVAAITFLLLFIPAIVLTLFYIFLSYPGSLITLSEGLGMKAYTPFQTVGIILFTLVLLIIYFLSLGSLTMLVNIFAKKRMLTILISLSIIILLKIVSIPPQFINYTFINGSSTIMALHYFEDSFLRNLQITVSTLAFILIFTLISMTFIRKQTYI